MAKPETTNIMTLKLTNKNLVRKDPPQLRVLANKKEIILKGDPTNTADIQVSELVTPQSDGSEKKVELQDLFIVSGGKPALPLVVKKGEEIKLKLRQDLRIKKRGTFEDDHDDEFSRRVNLKFNVEPDSSANHEDWHIEC